MEAWCSMKVVPTKPCKVPSAYGQKDTSCFCLPAFKFNQFDCICIFLATTGCFSASPSTFGCGVAQFVMHHCF